MFQQTLYLNGEGDLHFSRGKTGTLLLITGINKAKQDLLFILRTNKGSYIFDTTLGVDYITIMHSKRNNELIKKEFTDALKRYPYLKSIDSFTITPSAADPRIVDINVAVTLTTNQTFTLGVTV